MDTHHHHSRHRRSRQLKSLRRSTTCLCPPTACAAGYQMENWPTAHLDETRRNMMEAVKAWRSAAVAHGHAVDMYDIAEETDRKGEKADTRGLRPLAQDLRERTAQLVPIDTRYDTTRLASQRLRLQRGPGPHQRKTCPGRRPPQRHRHQTRRHSPAPRHPARQTPTHSPSTTTMSPCANSVAVNCGHQLAAGRGCR